MNLYKRAKLVHAGCGRSVRLGYYCPDCGELVRGSEVSLKRA
jgi:hypothetical protein